MSTLDQRRCGHFEGFEHKVAKEEGKTIVKGSLQEVSLQDCKDNCRSNSECNSFAFCIGETGSNCYLKDKLLFGTEPKKHHDYCTTYYPTCGK